jgi:hypothetical protein
MHHAGMSMPQGSGEGDSSDTSMPVDMPTPKPVDGAVRPPPAAAPSANIYTCSMHQDVESEQPGKCPKCGMKLIRKKGAGANP